MSKRGVVVVSTAALTLSTYALFHVVLQLFPRNSGLIGFDYQYALPYIVSGRNWFRVNGWLEPAYFTPAFCGGIPWFANPLSMLYSMPQALTFVVNPVAAFKWTLLISAMGGALTSFLLLRRVFLLSIQSAVLGAALFEMNSFLIFRLAIGHVPYHVIGYLPFFCLLVLPTPEVPGRRRLDPILNFVARSVLGGLVLAVLVYSGAPNVVVPFLLAATLIVAMRQIASGVSVKPWLLIGTASIWGGLLSLAKLVPAAKLALDYPRPYLPAALWDDPARFVATLLKAFFAPELITHLNMTNARPGAIEIGMHELEFGLSVVPLLLFAALAVVWLRRDRSTPRRSALHGVRAMLFPGCIAILIIALPLAGTLGSEGWGQILVKVPIINNTMLFERWWMIYILALIACSSLAFDRLFHSDAARTAAMFVLISIAATQLLARKLDYYRGAGPWQMYDSTPLLSNTGRIDNEGLPAVSLIDDESKGLLDGVSTLPCYEPLFGYFREWFPAKGLSAGRIEPTASESFFNLADPRCYLDGEAHQCRPGDQFQRFDRSDVEQFINWRPLPWRKPIQFVIAERITLVALFASLAVIAFTAAAQLGWPRRWRIN